MNKAQSQVLIEFANHGELQVPQDDATAKICRQLEDQKFLKSQIVRRRRVPCAAYQITRMGTKTAELEEMKAGVSV